MQLRRGVRNHLYHQKFPRYRWPLWVLSPGTGAGHPGIQPVKCLLNSTHREGMIFSNFLSSEELHIDRGGMISPSYAPWSVEIWIAGKNGIHRVADRPDTFRYARDLKDSTIRCTWEEKHFRLEMLFYGARTGLDEALVDIRVVVKEKAGASHVLVAVRPYNIEELGTVTAVRYAKDSKTVQVNGRRSLHVSTAPDSMHTSSAALNRDISMDQRGADVSCPDGMAAMALAFPLKSGENTLTLRVALDGAKDLGGGKIQYAKLRQSFTEFASMRLDGGMSLTLPDKDLEGWVRSSKISLMNFTGREVFRAHPAPDFKTGHLIVTALHRMGYFNEGAELIDGMSNALKFDEKHFTLNDAVAVSCVISSLGDHFSCQRDSEYLQAHFGYMKKIATPLIEFTSRIKKWGALGTNTIARNLLPGDHPLDYAIMCHALSHYSYCARCLGIFGEELKFAAEDRRLAEIYTPALTAAFSGLTDDFDGERYLSSFMFGAPSVLDAAAKRPPLLAPSAGLDVAGGLAMCGCMAAARDPAAVDAVTALLAPAHSTRIIPEFASPVDFRGVAGEGDSKVAAALAFTVIRNLMFRDRDERLELFPVPRAEWFEAGSEIRIVNAPSRYGMIGIKVVSTATEIQLHFEMLPKFVPPEIVITLPVKVKIVPEDDYILKKEFDTTFVINGWPSIVKFARV